MPKAEIQTDASDLPPIVMPKSKDVTIDKTMGVEPRHVKVKWQDVALDPVTDVRPGPPPKDEAKKIDALAKTMYEIGQEQAIGIRFNRAGLAGIVSVPAWSIVWGRRRLAAAQLIEKETGEEWLLDAIVLDLTDDQAFRAAAIENGQRENNSPISFALLVQNVRVRLFGDLPTDADWANNKINQAQAAKLADWFGCSKAKITESIKLLTLPEQVQAKVHAGQLSASAAFDLAAIPSPLNQAKVLKKAQDAANAEATAKPPSTQTTSEGASGQFNNATIANTGIAGGVEAIDSTPKKGKKPSTPPSPAPVKSKHIRKAARELNVMETAKARTRPEILSALELLNSPAAYPKVMCGFIDYLLNEFASGKASDDKKLRVKWGQIAMEVEGLPKLTELVARHAGHSPKSKKTKPIAKKTARKPVKTKRKVK